jgi:hypothetical protein
MKNSGRILTFACSLALAAVALMVWSLFDPRPIPVVVAMSVGQVLGTLSLLAFVYVVVADWRAHSAGTQTATASVADAPHEVPR